MLKAKILHAFNSQLNAELYSSYLYLSMAAYFESQNLKGMTHWMRMQVQEETMHAMKFFDFINQRGGKVSLTQIEAPKDGWKSPLAAFTDAYEHECLISSRINELADLSISEKDHAANAFLQWFITEQVEEEATVQEIIDKLKLAGDDGAVLFMIDQELGQRPAPAASAEDVAR